VGECAGVEEEFAPLQSIEATAVTFGRVQAALNAKYPAGELVEMVLTKFGHDVLLSNLKNVELPTAPDGLEVEAVWGPSVYVNVEGEHVVGAATFEGALHLVYTSFTPIEGLLETARQTIADACWGA